MNKQQLLAHMLMVGFKEDPMDSVEGDMEIVEDYDLCNDTGALVMYIRFRPESGDWTLMCDNNLFEDVRAGAEMMEVYAEGVQSPKGYDDLWDYAKQLLEALHAQ